MRLLYILLFLTLFSATSFADPPKAAEPRLFSPLTATGTGDSIPLALELKLRPKWDTYWRSPGDAGLPPDLDWSGSTNLKEAKILYPPPVRQVVAGINNHIYIDKVTFPIDVKLQKAGDALDLKLKLNLLVCNENMCVPEKHELSFNLPAGMAQPSSEAALYEEALAKLPKDQISGYSFGRTWLTKEDGKLFLNAEATLPGKPSDVADLFVEHPSYTAFGKPQITYNEAPQASLFKLEVNSNKKIDEAEKELKIGDYTLTYTDGATALEATVSPGEAPEDGPKPMPGTKVERAKETMEGVSLSVLFAAFLGGLILNLMPCVLPVLSIKVLSVVSHGGHSSRAVIFRNFMASGAGIIASFWLMAGGLVALKSAGSSIGWGIQFQHPGFLVFLIVIVLAFAASMWGLYEIPLPRFIANKIPSQHEKEPTAMGHFLTGAFATLLATPCTAPFLGTAIGFALARGAYEIFMIFTFIGLGLALPYMLLAISPALFKYMPKPGAWMVRFKRVLAIALLLTAFWLVNVLVTITTMPVLDKGWQKFEASLVAPAVAEGKTVMVDVTADWCLTCKANKKFVLEQDDVIEALSAPNILRLQADWTTHDEAIGAYLKTFGRYGIPFNVVYGPARPDGIPLPELLTKQAVMDALQEAAGE